MTNTTNSAMHLIEVDKVTKKHTTLKKANIKSYLVGGKEYFSTSDVSMHISVQDYRVLLSENTSIFISSNKVQVCDKKYEVLHNCLNGLRPGDVVSETELVQRMNALNRPELGNEGIEYFKTKFPDLFKNLFKVSTKPLHKRLS